jgi:hypothetical protein
MSRDQDYKDLAQGVLMIRKALEETFGAGILPSIDELQTDTAIEECELIAKAISALAPPSEDDFGNDLHQAINGLVMRRLMQMLRTGETVNVLEWVEHLVDALADLIVSASPREQRPRLIEHAIEELPQSVRDREDAIAASG